MFLFRTFLKFNFRVSILVAFTSVYAHTHLYLQDKRVLKALGTYTRITLSRVPLLERPSSYLPFLYVTVNFVFSRRYLLLFSLFAICNFSPRALRSSLFFYEPEEKTQRHDGIAIRSILRFRVPAF